MKLEKIFSNKKSIIYIFIFIVLSVFCKLLINKVYATEIKDYKTSEVYEENILNSNSINDQNKIQLELEKTVNNKIIIVGDSRMEYIEKESDIIDIPVNFSFIALSGSKIDWFEKKAIGLLKNKLDEAKKDINYHVIYNMGVNDLESKNNMFKLSKDYYTLYRDIANEYQNINFYILSINPVDEDKMYKSNGWVGRTDKKVYDYNENIKGMINNDKLDNIYYCDSYNMISFNSPDGLHYDSKTDQKIVNFIANNCINK